jgi:hypothetical protein
MIVAYTAYDPTSEALAKLAAVLIERAGTRVQETVAPPRVTTTHLQPLLEQKKDCALFFFGHGRKAPPALMGQNQQPVIDSQNDHLLRGRLVYATSCHSTAVLQEIAANHGATVLGYHCALKVPLIPPYEDDMLECALAGAFALLKGESAAKALAVMKKGFREVAQKLIGGSMQDQAFAVEIFDWNADAVAIVGNDSRTM